MSIPISPCVSVSIGFEILSEFHFLLWFPSTTISISPNHFCKYSIPTPIYAISFEDTYFPCSSSQPNHDSFLMTPLPPAISSTFHSMFSNIIHAILLFPSDYPSPTSYLLSSASQLFPSPLQWRVSISSPKVYCNHCILLPIDRWVRIQPPNIWSPFCHKIPECFHIVEFAIAKSCSLIHH